MLYSFLLQKKKLPDFFILSSFLLRKKEGLEEKEPPSTLHRNEEEKEPSFSRPSFSHSEKEDGKEKEGGSEKNIVDEIKQEFAQYNGERAKKYLEYNNIEDIVKSKKIKSVEEFFKKERINSNTFLTGLQKEILKQSGKKKFTPAALQMSDFELTEAYKEGDSIFLR